MRKNPTRSELFLWQYLRRFRKAGVIWRRQFPMGVFIVDFYCPRLRLVIEVDGKSHEGNEKYDATRQSIIERKLGARFLRFTNSQLLNNRKEVYENIKKACGINGVVPYMKFQRKAIPTFPQGQQLQDDPTLKRRVEHTKPPCDDDECGGNVEIERIRLINEGLLKGKPRGYFDVTVDNRKPCRRQVYSSLEVAENTARALRGSRILCKVERCKICKLVHLEELHEH